MRDLFLFEEGRDVAGSQAEASEKHKLKRERTQVLQLLTRESPHSHSQLLRSQISFMFKAT